MKGEEEGSYELIFIATKSEIFEEVKLNQRPRLLYYHPIREGSSISTNKKGKHTKYTTSLRNNKSQIGTPFSQL